MEKDFVKKNNYYDTSKKRFLKFLIFGTIILFSGLLLSLFIGNYNTSIKDVIYSIFQKNFNPQIRSIIIYIRLPRLCAALLVGAALSVTGVVYQEIFKNRMASPDLLGVSSGAGVGASIAILLGLGFTLVSIYSFIFGLMSVLLTLIVSKIFSKNDDSKTTLILSGIVMGGFMNSLLGFIKFISHDNQLATITYWLMGGLNNVTYKQLLIVSLPMIIIIIILYLLRWKILIMKNGELDATIQGVNYKRIKIIVIILSTIVTGISVSISGNIGWIGLVIPNFSRLLMKNNQKYVLGASILLGVIFTVFSDLLARSLTYSEIPLSIITGLLGTIIFVIVLIIKKVTNE